MRDNKCTGFYIWAILPFPPKPVGSDVNLGHVRSKAYSMQNLEYPRNPAASWTPVRAREQVQTIRRLIPVGALFRFNKGLQIFAQGSRPEEVFLLESGIVKLAYTLPDGTTELFSLRYPGQLVEGCANVLRIPYPLSAFTITPCELYRLDAQRMLSVMRQDAEFANFIVRLQDIDLYNTGVALVEMKTLRPHERLERFLWDLAAVIGYRKADGSVRLVLPLSEKEIAELLGLSVMHLERSRKKLEQTGRVRRQDSRALILFEQ